MKINIQRELMESFSPEELFIWTVKPIALEMHSGKGPNHKYDVYKDLSGGQRAAFMFWVLYSHAPDEAGFYTWMPYMRLPMPDYWNQLRTGMKLLGCNDVLGFMIKCDEKFLVLEEMKSWTDFKMTDLEEPVLKKEIQTLYLEFRDLAPVAIDFIGIYIKDHISDFLKVI